jgi:DNA-binding IclR family transcriptional regulator
MTTPSDPADAPASCVRANDASACRPPKPAWPCSRRWRLGGRASLTAIAAQIDESPAKVHRYLVSLMEEGLWRRRPARSSTTWDRGLADRAGGDAAGRPVRLSKRRWRLRERLEVTCVLSR